MGRHRIFDQPGDLDPGLRLDQRSLRLEEDLHNSVTAFHHAFAASIVFGLLGIAFALRIHDEDAAASMQRALKLSATLVGTKATPAESSVQISPSGITWSSSVVKPRSEKITDTPSVSIDPLS